MLYISVCLCLLTSLAAAEKSCWHDTRTFSVVRQNSHTSPNFHKDTVASSIIGAKCILNVEPTSLYHIVFGIGAASHVLERRKEYISSWWRPHKTRGYVYVDKPTSNWSSKSLPELRISEDTSRFKYTYPQGSRSAIRISRIVSEIFRRRLPDVRWFVLGDDDTVFFVDNLVRVLSKYDHREYFYIGSSSENHIQNVRGFSSNMAYGGGGFAISYALAEALASIQDECLERYHFLYGSDDRIQACMAELGVQLTREPGFHQFDISGDASGILAAHPLAPAISLHHLNIIHPLFPNMSQQQSIRHLISAVTIDPGGILQQSICYDKASNLTIQISWGYLVQLSRGIIPPRLLELPLRTFSGWYGERIDLGFPFKTRALPPDMCDRPTRYYMESVHVVGSGDNSVSNYTRNWSGRCASVQRHGKDLKWVLVDKERMNESWYKAPRRQCCRIMDVGIEHGMHVRVGKCREKFV